MLSFKSILSFDSEFLLIWSEFVFNAYIELQNLMIWRLKKFCHLKASFYI